MADGYLASSQYFIYKKLQPITLMEVFLLRTNYNYPLFGVRDPKFYL